MATDLVIRTARSAEAEEIRHLTESAFRVDGFTDEEYSALLLDGSRRVRLATVLVAVLDGDLVGTVTVARHGTPYANICRAGEAEVRMLAVAHHARRQGIADRLMARAEQLASDASVNAVVLSTERDMHAAHRLYERRGYRRSPERDWAIGDVDLLVLSLEPRPERRNP